MAYQTFTFLPATQPYIRNAVHSQPAIFSHSIRRQLHTLLETPLKLATGREPKWTVQSPLVLVIDGLDECTGADRQLDIIKAMCQLASTIRSSTNRRLKILIASRPEKSIKDEFERNEKSTTIIELNPSDANIDLYYDTQLDKIRRDKNLPKSWPSPKQIEWLKSKTSGQYSFAHISMGFLAEGDPVVRWEMLETGVGTHGLEPFEAHDALYATVFRQIPPEMADNALLLVHLWLEYPRLALQRYSNPLERILSFPLGFTSRLFPYLSSILRVKSIEYSAYHASLGDFLRDPLRSRKYSLFLDLQAVTKPLVDGMFRICIPPTLPVDRATATSWLAGYDNLDALTDAVDASKVFSRCAFLPTMTAPLDRLRLLLPTMDLYTFGYCACFLSVLFEHLRVRENPLASDPLCVRTVGRLLVQIRSIQRARFATYEAMEAGGDAGLGLFGLLLIFVSHTSSGAWLRRAQEVIAHLIRVHEDLRQTEQSAQEPLSLRTLIRQVLTIRELASPCLNRLEVPSVGIWALLSTTIKDDLPKLPLCLSKAIGMFLDLPSRATRVQGQILDFIACPDHGTLHAQCAACASNLEEVQISVIRAVIAFLHAQWDESHFEDPNWKIDARVLVRCYNLVHASSLVRGHDSHHEDLERTIADLAEVTLAELEQEESGGEGVDASILEDLRTMVSSIYTSQGAHPLGWSTYHTFHVHQVPERSHDPKTGEDTETDSED